MLPVDEEAMTNRQREESKSRTNVERVDLFQAESRVAPIHPKTVKVSRAASFDVEGSTTLGKIPLGSSPSTLTS